MRRILVLLAGLALCASVVYPEVSAGAVTPTSLIVNSSTATIKTSTGAVVRVKLNGFRGSSTGPTFLTVTVSHGSSGGTEQHAWTFQLTTTSVSYSNTRGRGTITTATKQLGPFGLIKLTFVRTSAASRVRGCTSGSETRTPVAMSGILHFVPGGTWGSFGSSTVTFTFPKGSVVLLDHGCTPASAPLTCFTATNWASQVELLKTRSGHVVGSQFAFGSKTFVSGKAVGSIAGSRSATISNPAHASRADTITAPAPAPIGPTTKSPYTETETTKSGTLATGSAKEKGTTAPSTFTIGSCKKSTGTGTQKFKPYPKELYSTPSTSKLTLHSSVGGNIIVPNGTGTNYAGLTVFFHT